MKKTFNVLSVIALSLAILGSLNWLLVGIFSFNFITWVTFGMVWLERALYILIGVAGIYMLVWLIVSRAVMVQQDHRFYQENKTKFNQRSFN